MANKSVCKLNKTSFSLHDYVPGSFLRKIALSPSFAMQSGAIDICCIPYRRVSFFCSLCVIKSCHRK